MRSTTGWCGEHSASTLSRNSNGRSPPHVIPSSRASSTAHMGPGLASSRYVALVHGPQTAFQEGPPKEEDGTQIRVGAKKLAERCRCHYRSKLRPCRYA